MGAPSGPAEERAHPMRRRALPAGVSSAPQQPMGVEGADLKGESEFAGEVSSVRPPKRPEKNPPRGCCCSQGLDDGPLVLCIGLPGPSNRREAARFPFRSPGKDRSG